MMLRRLAPCTLGLLALATPLVVASCSTDSKDLEASRADGGPAAKTTAPAAGTTETPTGATEAPTGDRTVDPTASDAPSAPDPAIDPKTGLETATFGGGCFWCSEAVLEQVDGVKDVVSGFMGGHVANPTYREVCTGKTGHAEVVQVTFDPKVISYEGLLQWFWHMHDPTTLNRQGADVGEQYRSVIFTYSKEQQEIAERSKEEAQKDFSRPIVTAIEKAGPFYEAEDYHQDFYRSNKGYGYCKAVIVPKLEKLGLKK